MTAAIIALPLACVDNSAADLAGSAEAFPLEVEAFTRRTIWSFNGPEHMPVRAHPLTEPVVMGPQGLESEVKATLARTKAWLIGWRQEVGSPRT